MRSKQNTSKIVITAFLMAMEIVLTRFLSLALPTLRLSFGFLPISIIGILYGPLWSGIAYALGDIIGMMILPTGPYFPGFTLTAFLTGAVYGLILHNKPISWKRVFIAVAIVCIILNLCLDTLWLYILMNKGLFAILPTRLLKCFIMIPLQTVIIHELWNRYLSKLNFLKNHLNH
ncbi:folate family ECF transporter S component [Anaerovorax odorimutans]|uniref:folate family ECF transporter S component n=1 Tax=Anaerovorax odorimutans TaxID=109327 RepID=UPI0004127F75|nr:folate family ECF transporter S component [Anaerovorax odorimutans]